MTWRDVVREVFPNVCDATADALLWECTDFPMSGDGKDEIPHYREMLQEIHKRSGGAPSRAIDLAHQDQDEAMEEVSNPTILNNEEAK